jgi:diguanylate cyclase (GGDEF)-like protein
MARSLATLFAAAATLSLLALIVPHDREINERLSAGISVLAYPMAAGLLLAGDRVPRWTIHLLLLFGSAMVAIGVHSAGQGRVAGAASAFYLWIALYIGSYFTWPEIAVHLAAISVSFGAVLVIDGAEGAPALLLGVIGTAFATAVVVRSLASRLRQLASTDPLTALPNRRGWEQALERELARVRRRRTPLCVAVLDLDRFKEFNDEKGHLAGDRLLTEVAATWMGLLRDTDVLARYGGDEFGIILPDCFPGKAREIVDRLCQATSAGSTCSAGVAAAEDGVGMSELIDRADRALYRAKAAGGNRAVFHGAPDPAETTPA